MPTFDALNNPTLDVSETITYRTDECRVFCERIFTLHKDINKYLMQAYTRWCRSFGYATANQKLRGIDERLRFAGGSSSCVMSDETIKNLASVRSIQCESIYKGAAKKGDSIMIADILIDFCKSNGVEFPLSISKKDSQSKIAEKIICAALRVSSAKWWRRRLRVITSRQVESVLRFLGFVRSGKSPYVSKSALVRFRATARRNRHMLERMEAVTKDDNGEEICVSLAEAADSSISNPELRRTELMTRIAGFEKVAKDLEFLGAFFTLTCPSKYHAQHKWGGMNEKFNGATPIDAMQYLNGLWSRIRASWNRKGIKVFGFRVAEPNHDGTPHWHLFLFIHPSEIDLASEIFGRYALAEDGDEKGADKHRWDMKIENPEKGSAAGYIAKYIAKNIDGYQVGIDWEGDCDAAEGSERARCWASLWGIRQFQQLGSVSVTVWRELRRHQDPFAEDINCDELEALRVAADEGDWCEFVRLMGGPLVKRNQQTLRPEYSPENLSISTEYGESVKRLIGLWLQPVGRAIGRRLVPTREKVWTIREKVLTLNVVEPLTLEEAQPPPLDLCQ